MNWLKDFCEKFGNDEDIKNIKERKVHGSIKINLCDGIPVNVDLTIHKTNLKKKDNGSDDFGYKKIVK